MNSYNFPPDLEIAYETFVMLAGHHGFSIAGIGVHVDPPGVLILGNVKERGHDFSELLRTFADLLDRKVNEGKVVRDDLNPPPPSSVN